MTKHLINKGRNASQMFILPTEVCFSIFLNIRSPSCKELPTALVSPLINIISHFTKHDTIHKIEPTTILGIFHTTAYYDWKIRKAFVRHAASVHSKQCRSSCHEINGLKPPSHSHDTLTIAQLVIDDTAHSPRWPWSIYHPSHSPTFHPRESYVSTR